MSQNTVHPIVSKLSKLGVTAELLAERPGEADVALTAAQYEKLESVLPDTKFLKVKGKKIQACVFVPTLDAAVAAHVKAPRQSAGDVLIKSIVFYNVEAPEAVNIVTEAAWAAEDSEGYITINGTKFPIVEGIAAEYYAENIAKAEAEGKDTDPERPVYAITLNVQDEESAETVTLTAYGVVNLIKRVTALRKAVVGE